MGTLRFGYGMTNTLFILLFSDVNYVLLLHATKSRFSFLCKFESKTSALLAAFKHLERYNYIDYLIFMLCNTL